ncbi:O-antigen ligase family protein [Glutamicibacter sp. NPDC087344]|uniref:O-antigen ligase family protein n=1 Tax=Glutamicibacter sp. NPDC087344 TaxID=3363994 RepID=UPI003811150D
MTVTPHRHLASKHDLDSLNAELPIRHVATRAGALPSWPIFALIVGFPVWWALGAVPVMSPVLAVVMIFYLLNAKNLMMFPGIAPWFMFLLWVGATVIGVQGAGDLIGYGMRVSDLILAGVCMVYVSNAGFSLSKNRVVNYLVVIWLAMVVLGFLALLIPDVRLKTPVGMLLSESITSNELVRNLVMPPLAEVQQPWGAPEPFVRPAAPFPYANSWGAAFAVLVPVVLSRIATLTSRKRSILLGMVLVFSFIPAVATSNRGMFVGLMVALAYALMRHVGLGHWKVAVLTVIGTTTMTLVLVASGAVSGILGRQEFSDSTGGRMALYLKTWEQSLQAPLLGHGSPRIDPTIGVSLGSQGFLWTLMFCYGFVGLFLFLYFFVGAVIRTRRVSTMPDVWLHAALISGISLIPFYGLSVLQLSVLSIVFALLLRQRYVGTND